MKILKRKSFLCSIVAILVIALTFYFVGAHFQPNHEQQIRTMTLEEIQIDHQSVLDEFDDAEIKRNGTTVDFIGSKKIDASVFDALDNLSVEEKESLQNDSNVLYHFTYDSETNIVTLEAKIILADGTAEIEKIEGVGFINENDEIDAVMNVDGEGVLLSEMRDAGMIENCGWFSRFLKVIKKVAIAVAVVAAVVAVAAVVVATAGAAAPAVVATTIGVTTTVTATTAATAAALAIASTSFTVAMIAAGVAITAAVIDVTFEGVKYVLEEYSKVVSKLVKGLVFLAAASKDGKMYISPIPISVATGIVAYRAGLSTYSIDPAQAVAVCAGVAGSTTSPENHSRRSGDGYFWHYHTWNRQPKNAHAFFGAPL